MKKKFSKSQPQTVKATQSEEKKTGTEFQAQNFITFFIPFIEKYNDLNQTNIIIVNKSEVPEVCYVKTFGNLLSFMIQELIEIIINPLFGGETVTIETHISEKPNNLLVRFYIYQNKKGKSNNNRLSSLNNKLNLCKEIVNVLGGNLSTVQINALISRINLTLAKSDIKSSKINENCGISNQQNDVTVIVPKSHYSRVLAIIAENYSSQDFKSNQIAKHMHMSLRTLQRKLQDEVTVTLNTILYNYRIHVAKRLLLNSPSISNISFDCGFSSPSHFAKKFKQITGITAKDFIKLNNK
ncbi:MAG: helix-turn-helix transcriptional regulator [Proteobacteria bacterium]|nr:helix-turn-helix transcriptional regulator [Pseudomonadota bacterium]